jgi:hypothetical protein
VSRSLGARLPPGLLDAFAQRDLPARLGRALPLVTVDAQGRPHPMLCSYLELLATDVSTLRLVIGAGSRSATNLEAGRGAALLVVEPERTVYVKLRGTGLPLAAPPLVRFTLLVEEVLEDLPAEWEGGVGITSGITYAPPPRLEEAEVRAILDLLRRDLPDPARRGAPPAGQPRPGG